MWTYKQYLAIYGACDGVTYHFVPHAGLKVLSKVKLPPQEFETKMRELTEIESHEEEWYFQFEDALDRVEEDGIRHFWLKSDLFLFEWERAQLIVVKVREAE